MVPQRSSHPNHWNLQMLPSMEEEKKQLQWGIIQVDPMESQDSLQGEEDTGESGKQMSGGYRRAREADVRERFADATFSALKMLRC